MNFMGSESETKPNGVFKTGKRYHVSFEKPNLLITGDVKTQ